VKMYIKLEVIAVLLCLTFAVDFQNSLKASRYSVFGVTKNPSYDVSSTSLLFRGNYRRQFWHIYCNYTIVTFSACLFVYMFCFCS